MREERGLISGRQSINEPYTLWGSIAGDVDVTKGGKFYLRGSIYGSLTVLPGGRCHIFGNVQGDLVIHKGAKVIHSGLLGGDAINQGGRLYIDTLGIVRGMVKTMDGKTVQEQAPPPPPQGAQEG